MFKNLIHALLKTLIKENDMSIFKNYWYAMIPIKFLNSLSLSYKNDNNEVQTHLKIQFGLFGMNYICYIVQRIKQIYSILRVYMKSWL